MKKSNILILFVMGAAALLLIVFTAGMRVHIDRNFIEEDGSAAKIASISETLLERSYSISGFTAVETQGPWSAEISRGSDHRVSITAPENIIELIEVSKKGRRLFIGLKDNIRLPSSLTLDASISMPALESVISAGGMNLLISKFDGDKIDITGAGVLNLDAEDCSFNRMELSISGAGNIKGENLPVKDINVNLAGAVNSKIRIAGGTLSGSLSGAGNLTYYGEAKKIDVSTSGATSIKYGGK